MRMALSRRMLHGSKPLRNSSMRSFPRCRNCRPASKMPVSALKGPIESIAESIPDPIFKAAIKEPVAFWGGVFSGILRLSLNEDPLKSWIERTGDPKQQSKIPEPHSPRGKKHVSFEESTYFMTKGSETPAHHGTVQAMHLHDPHGIEPPFSELPIEHHCKSLASEPVSTAQASGAKDSSLDQH